MKTEESKLEAQQNNWIYLLLAVMSCLHLMICTKHITPVWIEVVMLQEQQFNKNDKLIKADDFITFMRKHYY